MDLFFATPRLQRLLESSKEVTKAYGPENAKTIRKRIDNLRFAEDLSVMPTLPGHFEALRGNRAGTFSLRLRDPYRLVFAAREMEGARRPDGTLDWSMVRAVEILEIVDYHE